MFLALSQAVLFFNCIFRLAVALRLEMASKKSKHFWARLLVLNMSGYSGLECV